MKLIGLHGGANAGKDTVADWLCARHAYSRLALAGPIKDGLISMLGLSRFDLEDPIAKDAILTRYGKSPRQLMQTLGTEWGRDLVHEDIWILRAEERLRQYRKFASSIVVTDIRRENEAQWVRRQGGAIWHILRPLPRNVTGLHPTEAGIAIVLGLDSVIQNVDGLEQLRAEIAHALAGECIVHAPAA